MESAVAEKKKSPAGGPACWKGKKIHPTKPTKMKGGKRVNNCIDAGTNEDLDENKLLKVNKLSSFEYQKAKKLKGFDKSKYTWDSKQQLYVKEEVEQVDEVSNKTLSDYVRKATKQNTDFDNREYASGVKGAYDLLTKGKPSEAEYEKRLKRTSGEERARRKLQKRGVDDTKISKPSHDRPWYEEVEQVDEGKNTYLVKAETGPHQYSEMKIDATSPAQAEKIFRKSYKHPMGLTVTKLKESVEQEKYPRESFDPSAEPREYDELMDIYHQIGEEGLADALGLSPEELDREISELAHELDKHADDDREELIIQIIDDTLSNADHDNYESIEENDFDMVAKENTELSELRKLAGLEEGWWNRKPGQTWEKSENRIYILQYDAKRGGWSLWSYDESDYDDNHTYHVRGSNDVEDIIKYVKQHDLEKEEGFSRYDGYSFNIKTLDQEGMKAVYDQVRKLYKAGLATKDSFDSMFDGKLSIDKPPGTIKKQLDLPLDEPKQPYKGQQDMFDNDLKESYPMGMDADNNTTVSFNQSKKIGDTTININAQAKDIAELQKVLQMAGLAPEGAEQHMPEPDSVQVVDVDPEPSPCGGDDIKYSTDKQALVDMLRNKLQSRLG